MILTIQLPQSVFKYKNIHSLKNKKNKNNNNREEKTKFTLNVIALLLRNIRAECSEEDSEEEKQFSDQVKEITSVRNMHICDSEASG